MIHRAILGSFKILCGILIEHYDVDFPLCMSPMQAHRLPVTNTQKVVENKLEKNIIFNKFDTCIHHFLKINLEMNTRQQVSLVRLKLDWIKIYSNKPLIIKSKTKEINQRRNDCRVVFSSDVYLVLVTYNHAKKGSLAKKFSVNHKFKKLNENLPSLHYKNIQV